MKTYLLNSTVMPQAGQYQLTQIDQKIFEMLVVDQYKKGNLVSAIGYPQNVELIENLTGVTIAISRDKVTFERGDKFLVMRLKYRVQDPNTKGKPVSEDDFEFFMGDYK